MCEPHKQAQAVPGPPVLALCTSRQGREAVSSGDPFSAFALGSQ